MRNVRGYYDSNTWKWLLSGTDGALHRELWGPGVNDRHEALHYIHRRILDHVTAQFSSSRARIVDFGCGVGTGVCYLAERIPADVHGITLSPRQVVHARRRADRRAGVLSGSCRFHEADFCRLPSTVVDSVAGADVVYAIESFVHAESAAAFFDAVVRLLRPGGQLILVDDMLTPWGVVAQGDPAIEDFRAGWQVASLFSGEQAVALAARSGLSPVSRTSLSDYQRLGRPRDRVVRATQPILRRARRYSHWCQSLVGGDALQRCHLAGLIEYVELVLTRVR